jgi:hypothetical protein
VSTFIENGQAHSGIPKPDDVYLVLVGYVNSTLCSSHVVQKYSSSFTDRWTIIDLTNTNNTLTSFNFLILNFKHFKSSFINFKFLFRVRFTPCFKRFISLFSILLLFNTNLMLYLFFFFFSFISFFYPILFFRFYFLCQLPVCF